MLAATWSLGETTDSAMDKTLDDLNPFLKRFGKRRDDVTAEEWREKFFRPMTGPRLHGPLRLLKKPA